MFHYTIKGSLSLSFFLLQNIIGYKLPIRGVAFVTGSMSPTIVLNNTIASSKFTPKYIIFVPKY